MKRPRGSEGAAPAPAASSSNSELPGDVSKAQNPGGSPAAKKSRKSGAGKAARASGASEKNAGGKLSKLSNGRYAGALESLAMLGLPEGCQLGLPHISPEGHAVPRAATFNDADERSQKQILRLLYTVLKGSATALFPQDVQGVLRKFFGEFFQNPGVYAQVMADDNPVQEAVSAGPGAGAGASASGSVGSVKNDAYQRGLKQWQSHYIVAPLLELYQKEGTPRRKKREIMSLLLSRDKSKQLVRKYIVDSLSVGRRVIESAKKHQEEHGPGAPVPVVVPKKKESAKSIFLKTWLEDSKNVKVLRKSGKSVKFRILPRILGYEVYCKDAKEAGAPAFSRGQFYNSQWQKDIKDLKPAKA